MYPRYDGSVEAEFMASEQEILRDLHTVIEAVQLKPVRLTKSGIPPKPLWGAINQRLVWRDPGNVLYDWEEVDQVRFVYLLARELDLVRPDRDAWLSVGPGADQFFLADRLERAHLVGRAYIHIEDWDERCDARNQEGHRHNFGRAYRRDFVYDVVDLRREVLARLRHVPEAWVSTTHLALELSREVPELLLSEVSGPAEVDAQGLDLEKLRFVNYCFTLFGRFGWADMARSPGLPEGEGAGKAATESENPNASEPERLCRLTDLGARLVRGEEQAAGRDDDGACPIASDEQHLVLLRDRGAEVSDRYAVERLCGDAGKTENEMGEIYPIGLARLSQAHGEGADLDACLTYIERRSSAPLPDALPRWAREVTTAPQVVNVVHNAVALELEPGDNVIKHRLELAGFTVRDGIAVAAGRDVPRLFAAAGTEPDEGFDYPLDEPLAVWRAGPELRFHYEALPLQQRDLLTALGAEGDPPRIRFSPENLAVLGESGWTLDSLCDALRSLSMKSVPTNVRSLFAEVLD